MISPFDPKGKGDKFSSHIKTPLVSSGKPIGTVPSRLCGVISKLVVKVVLSVGPYPFRSFVSGQASTNNLP